MLDDKIALLPAFERNDVPVAVVANNRYAPYAGVFIRSLLDYASEGNNYDIVVFNHEISEGNKDLLKSLAAGYTNVSIRFYDPTPLFALFDLNCEDGTYHWPIEIFCKILFPHILNYSGRVISVDIDTLLKTDIARLKDQNLEEFSVGAVYDIGIIGMYLSDHSSFAMNMRIRDYFQNVCGFGMDDIKNYMNTGLLLFDRDKYVQELDIEAILNTTRRKRYVYPEQDALNVLMKGRIKPLDFAWNVFVRSTLHGIKLLDAASQLYGGACERAYERPYLLHWTGTPKPWVCPDVPWGSEWWQTALRTPFMGQIIARMFDEQEKRRAYYRKRYGKEVDIWDPSPKGIDRT